MGNLTQQLETKLKLFALSAFYSLKDPDIDSNDEDSLISSKKIEMIISFKDLISRIFNLLKKKIPIIREKMRESSKILQLSKCLILMNNKK